MANILIIEDEPLAAKRLAKLLLEVDPDINIVEVLDSVEESIPWLEENGTLPELIFMDIHLADGLSFDILDKIKVDIPIIFATAYDQYAIRAFKHNSVDYLLKPIDQEELSASWQKFKKHELKSEQIDYQALIQAMKPTKLEFQKRFIVSSGEKIKSIKIEDVAYFFGQKKYVFLVSKDNRKYIIDYTLGKLENLLDPEEFFRINRQYIIKFDAIQNMYAYSKSRIKIDLNPPGEIEAIVSIDKSRLFKEWLNK